MNKNELIKLKEELLEKNNNQNNSENNKKGMFTELLYIKNFNNKSIVNTIEQLLEKTVKELTKNNISFDTIKIKVYPSYSVTEKFYYANADKLDNKFNILFNKDNINDLLLNFNIRVFDYSRKIENIDQSIYSCIYRLEQLPIQTNYIAKTLISNDNKTITNNINYEHIVDLIEMLGYEITYVNAPPNETGFIITSDFRKNKTKKLEK